MEVLKMKYETLSKRIKTNQARINQLLNDPSVQEYINLLNENEILNKEFRSIAPEYEYNRMINCSHVYLIGDTSMVEDEYKKDDKISYYCPKCNLYSYYFDNGYPPEFLGLIERDMGPVYVFTKDKAIFTDIVCHPVLADKIYEKLITDYPNINDEDLIKYFKLGLENIKHQDEEVYVKHLGLKKDYKKAIR